MHITCNEGEEEVSGWIINLFAGNVEIITIIIKTTTTTTLYIFRTVGWRVDLQRAT